MSTSQELRECQKDALAIISSRRGELGETNISMCTGSGKSVVIRESSKLPDIHRVLLVFPSLLLIQQFYHDHHKALKDKNVIYFATDGTLKGVKQLSADFRELNTHYIILTTYASVPHILSVLSDDRKVDRLIADEAHHIKGPVYKAAYSAAVPFIRHTIHLSATLPEGKEAHYKYPLLKGIRDGVVRDFNIELFICKNGEETGLLQMVDKLVALHGGKAKILIYTAEANTDGSSVRTFMTQYASAVRARGWWIEGIYAETTERDSVLRAFEADKSPATILVSCRTLSEGIDLKNGNCVLPWDPSASVVDNIQRIGRVLRLYKTASGTIAKDQPPSTILIPVFLEEAEYAACRGDRDAVHALLEKQISDGERGNFRPIVNVCTALKSELAEEDSDLFNQLLNYPYTPKVRVDKDLVACVAKQLKRPEEEVLAEVADSLVEKGELDEDVIDAIRGGEWESEEMGAVVTALAESQGIRLVIRDNEEEDVVGTGAKEVVVERKGEGVYTASRKKKSSDAAHQRVAHRLRTSFSDGCKILLGLEGDDLSATEGLVLARLTTEVQYDEDWEKRRLEWVAMYEKLGKKRPSSGSKNPDEKRIGKWHSHQCEDYKNKLKCMTTERITILEETEGWVWENDSWEINRLNWIAQYQTLGKNPSQGSKDPEEKKAANWRSMQRKNYIKNYGQMCMTVKRIELLESIEGWTWEDEDSWEINRLHWIAMYSKLGNKKPSASSKDLDEKKAGTWQSQQRIHYKKKSSWMTPGRISILEATEGWAWETKDTWEPSRVHWLETYKRLDRELLTTSSDVEEQNAAIWQNTQRCSFRHKNSWMTPERIKKLEETEGWTWERKPHTNSAWELKRIEWLSLYKILKNNTPSQSSKNSAEKKAAVWQNTQRVNYKSKQQCMTPERIAILNATPGWSWSSDSSPVTPFVPTPAPTNEVIYPTEVAPEKKRSILVRKRVIPSESVSTKEAATRTISTLEELHKAYKTRNADTYFSLMQANPSKFEEYHAVADAYDARDPPERKPQNRIAEMLKKINRASYKAIDLGCGRNALRRDERVSKMSWDSVDVVAVDSTVTVADMGHLPFEDETYDIAILNRSLWARNHEVVLREVWRILKEGCRAIICESFQRWQNEARENTLLIALKAVGFTILSEVGTTTDSGVEDVFQYIEVRRG